MRTVVEVTCDWCGTSAPANETRLWYVSDPIDRINSKPCDVCWQCVTESNQAADHARRQVRDQKRGAAPDAPLEVIPCAMCHGTRLTSSGEPCPDCPDVSPFEPAAPAPTLALATDYPDALWNAYGDTYVMWHKQFGTRTNGLPSVTAYEVLESSRSDLERAIRADERSRIAAEGREGTDSARLAELDRVLPALLEVAEAITTCQCDEAWTARGRHESNAHCHDLDDEIAAVRAALSQSPPTAAPADEDNPRG